MKDSLYKILNIICLITIAVLLYRIGTEIHVVGNQIWKLVNTQ